MVAATVFGMGRLASSVIALLFVVVTVGCNGQQETITVPDVIGLNEVEAVQNLDAAGLRAEAAVAEQADEVHGTVVEQDPDPGTEVQAASTVTLSVAREGS